MNESLPEIPWYINANEKLTTESLIELQKCDEWVNYDTINITRLGKNYTIKLF